jgi:hypothetical protein
MPQLLCFTCFAVYHCHLLSIVLTHVAACLGTLLLALCSNLLIIR